MAKRLKTPKSKGKQQKEAQPSAEKGKDLSAGKKSRPNTAGSQREAPKEPIVTTEQREEPSKVRTRLKMRTWMSFILKTSSFGSLDLRKTD